MDRLNAGVKQQNVLVVSNKIWGFHHRIPQKRLGIVDEYNNGEFNFSKKNGALKQKNGFQLQPEIRTSSNNKWIG